MVNKKKHPGGRPVLDLDERQIKELAKIQCTMTEIAAVMGCHVDTLRDRYSNVIEEGREIGKSSLRKAQWVGALGGNAALLMFLGKFYLGQREEITLTSNEGDVRRLLEQWEVTARKKSTFDRAKDSKIVAIESAS